MSLLGQGQQGIQLELHQVMCFWSQCVCLVNGIQGLGAQGRVQTVVGLYVLSMQMAVDSKSPGQPVREGLELQGRDLQQPGWESREPVSGS